MEYYTVHIQYKALIRVGSAQETLHSLFKKRCRGTIQNAVVKMSVSAEPKQH